MRAGLAFALALSLAGPAAAAPDDAPPAPSATARTAAESEAAPDPGAERAYDVWSDAIFDVDPAEHAYELSFGPDALRAIACRPQRGLAPRTGDLLSRGTSSAGLCTLLEEDRGDGVEWRLGDLRRGLLEPLARGLIALGFRGTDGLGVRADLDGRRLLARLDGRGHASLEAVLSRWRRAARREVAITARLYDVPAGDPLLSPLREGGGRPGVASEDDAARLASGASATEGLLASGRGAAPAGPRLLFAERRTGLTGEVLRLRRVRSSEVRPRLQLSQIGVVPVLLPEHLRIPEGAEIEVLALPAPGGRGVRIAVRAAESAIVDARRERFRGTTLDLPAVEDTALQACVDVEDGAAAAFILGPRVTAARAASGPARHVVLLVEARLEPAAAALAAPVPVALEEPGAAPLLASVHDTAALLFVPHGVESGPSSDLVFPPPGSGGGPAGEVALLARWRALADLEEGAIQPLPGGVALVSGPPEVQARATAALAAIERAAPRPARIDAWVLAGEPPPPVRDAAGGAISDALARTLLARAAPDHELVLLAAFGGGALAPGSMTARGRLRTAFTGRVDVVAGGNGKRVDIVGAPAPCVAESGLALEVRLRPTAPGGLAIDVRATAQEARLDRTARMPTVPGGEDVTVTLPALDRVEWSGRASVGEGEDGGWALFRAEGEAAREMWLLVRVAR